MIGAHTFFPSIQSYEILSCLGVWRVGGVSTEKIKCKETIQIPASKPGRLVQRHPTIKNTVWQADQIGSKAMSADMRGLPDHFAILF